jgi:hypothetical protein
VTRPFQSAPLIWGLPGLLVDGIAVGRSLLAEGGCQLEVGVGAGEPMAEDSDLADRADHSGQACACTACTPAATGTGRLRTGRARS